PLPVERADDDELDDDGGGDREEGAGPALEKSEGEVARDEHAGDQRRREIAMIDAHPPRRGRRRGHCSGRHAGSWILWILFGSGRDSSSLFPDGQRTTALSTAADVPSPKCRRRWFCEQ